MKQHLIKVWGVIWVVLIAACGDKTHSSQPAIDASNPYKPLIKIAVTAAQAQQAQKAGWETISGLFVINNGIAATTPIGCQYTFSNDTLYYTPRQPLGVNMQFAVLYITSSDTLRTEYATPATPKDISVPAVAGIYPLADTIPANILMFHVTFTKPMVEDVQTYKQIKLLDEKGVEKQMVWRHKSNWADDGKHLVLMLHPGRVKRGIHYFEKEDKLFEEGKRYTLVITSVLRDRDNQPLEKEFTKTFVVTAADRVIPTFKQQYLVVPQNGTQQPLEVVFDDKMDFGTMQIGLEVKDNKGNKVEGFVHSINDKVWAFVPAKPWQPAEHKLLLNTYVTDLSGNHLTRRFEEENIEEMKQQQTIEIAFTPKN